MKAEEIKKHVDAIIENTFKYLQTAYSHNKEGIDEEQVTKSRLVFPHYSLKQDEKLKIRISEQELRFAFAEAFIQYCAKPTTTENSEEVKKWHYSIETPTAENYIFTKKDGDKKDVPRRGQGGEGQSARFDFVIHNAKLDRICLIEFKALNPEPKDYYKDFEKLIHDQENEPNVVRYFIQVLKSCNRETPSSIAKKLRGENEEYKEYFIGETPKIEYRCHVLEKTKNCKLPKEIIQKF